MNAVPKYDSLVFHEAALKLRTQRQEILANNLANSDTPGYKARDIDFAKTLENELAGKSRFPSSIPLALTHQAHIAIKPSVEDSGLLYRVPSVISFGLGVRLFARNRSQFSPNTPRMRDSLHPRRHMAWVRRG